MIERQQQESRGLISPVVCFNRSLFPYALRYRLKNQKIDCLVLGTYVFPLAMFFLVFATQYFPNLNFGFRFKESEHAATVGFPTTLIITKEEALDPISR
jgi:hypothetical protein